MKFSDIAVGAVATMPVYVVSMTDDKTKSGNNFVKLYLKDGDSEIKPNIFDKSVEELSQAGVSAGAIANATIKYDGRFYNVSAIEPYNGEELSLADFIKMPPIPLDTMYEEIIEIVSAAENNDGEHKSIAELTKVILEKYKEQYMRSSAALHMHHNILGGLLYHSYRMVKSADALSKVYDNIDKELLVCGAALHDIGKIMEYNTSDMGDTAETSLGLMNGHIFLGASMIRDFARKDRYDNERVLVLIHMILSHHGELEWGAVVTPATPEAMLLHYIDNIDAKMYMFEETLKNMESGEMTEKKPFGLNNRVYKKKS